MVLLVVGLSAVTDPFRLITVLCVVGEYPTAPNVFRVIIFLKILSEK